MTSHSDDGDGSIFHPLFNDETADIIISSNFGTLYRLHQHTLHKNSKLLAPILVGRRDSFVTPPPNSQTNVSSSNSKKIDYYNTDMTLPFPDPPIERVLSMISGLPIDPWKSFTELEETVDVIQYVDTPGPLIMPASCLVPVCLEEPARLYGLATKFGWDEVAQHAAQLTFSLNLLGDVPEDNPSLEDELSKLESATALLKLLKLHQRRRDQFRQSLHSPALFGTVNLREWICLGCWAHRDNVAGRDLRSRLLSEMDHTVDGENISNIDTGLGSWEETGLCFEARCKCGRLFYDKVELLRKIGTCVRQLPKSL